MTRKALAGWISVAFTLGAPQVAVAVIVFTALWFGVR